jgi:thymidylate synthase (FAD)
MTNWFITDFAEMQKSYTGKTNQRKWIVNKPETLERYFQLCNYKPSVLAKNLNTSYATVKRFLTLAGLWSKADIKKTNSGGRKRTATEDKYGYIYADKEYDVITDTGDVKRRYQHHVVAEQKLGRPLADEEMVHHINLDKKDNRPENLHICNNSTHKKIHHDLEALAGRLMTAGYFDFIPELEEYIYTGPQIKLEKKISNGFVKIVDLLGNDATVVNSARVSFGKNIQEIRDKDKKLLDYLAKHKHTSPFRHCYVQLHIKAPELVARQWYKHIVGGEYSFKDQPWNEISGRYVEFDQEFWIPNEIRPQSKDNKQASEIGTTIEQNEEAVELFKNSIDDSYTAYEKLLKLGASKEQARGVLPISFYTEWYWTASLQTLSHFVNLRDHEGAQWEIREYAIELDYLLQQVLPYSWKALRRNENER